MIKKFIPQQAEDFVKWQAEIDRRLERLDRFVLKVSVPS
jgi:hypothetical protein